MEDLNRAEHCYIESLLPTATKFGQTELRRPGMLMLTVLLEFTWSHLFISQMGKLRSKERQRLAQDKRTGERHSYTFTGLFIQQTLLEYLPEPGTVLGAEKHGKITPFWTLGVALPPFQPLRAGWFETRL